MEKGCATFALSWPDGEDAVEWRYPDPHDASWRKCTKVSSVQWADEGPICEAGARFLRARFGLTCLEEELPLEVISKMSPCQLMAMRRDLEARKNLRKIEKVTSDRAGDHILAELAA